ncbi:glycosyltransferase family 2 protein [Fulvivirgaceae bacterium BMA10]|uniref:Glycosyltransferase family 2 protein n=1 Tax=Splendidivirga corallicola TaxID=3051826 RepID=A0ABT8KSD5_9BACT|nr:glycosyltransferase family 2 protein [Fulvivirgaceae bacterium BMA10]
MNNSQEPLVSIGIPTYNRCQLLERALTSIQNQNYKNFEIIISDNASPDETEVQCRKWAESDQRIQYFRQKEGINFIYNFDFVQKKATGKYFMWLADDDWLGENVIEKYVQFLEENTDYSVVSGQILNLRDDKIHLIEPDYTFEETSAARRVLRSFQTMHYCGMYYGLMRGDCIKKIPLKRIMLHDWLVLGGLASLGKVKTFDFPGYYKKLDGMSGDFLIRYSRAVGASKFETNFTHFSIASHIFRDILFNRKVYSNIFFPKRIIVAFRSFWAVVRRYYVIPIRESKSKQKGFARKVSRPFKDTIRHTFVFKFLKNIKTTTSRLFS